MGEIEPKGARAEHERDQLNALRAALDAIHHHYRVLFARYSALAIAPTGAMVEAGDAELRHHLGPDVPIPPGIAKTVWLAMISKRPKGRDLSLSAEGVPPLSPAQMEWLRTMLIPSCCHTSGAHDPRHFIERRSVCTHQKAGCYDRLRRALGLGDVTPHEATSREECIWCHQDPATTRLP